MPHPADRSCIIAKPNQQGYEPSPEEIAAACQRIQATWSARERASRYVGQLEWPWSAPQVEVKECGLD